MTAHEAGDVGLRKLGAAQRAQNGTLGRAHIAHDAVSTGSEDLARDAAERADRAADKTDVGTVNRFRDTGALIVDRALLERAREGGLAQVEPSHQWCVETGARG